MTNLEVATKAAAGTNTYDDLPYPNHSFSYACPEHLYSIATIFGLTPPPVETAKILDLGCGSGGNIIGFAERYPKAKVVGVDLSNVQIEQGQKLVKALGLKNIELKNISIADIDESFGKFDYIISHGVFSWVPKEIQEKILEILQKNLTSNGIAYVSYNTLPGWNISSTFREMLQYHTDSFSDSKAKLEQARAFIGFLNEGLTEAQTPYAKFLKQEAETISSSDNSYLKHEYLDRGNSELYFVDFIKMAAQHGLHYLADTSVASMYIGNLPQKAIEKLQSITDIIRVEQYMDFITNRRFRCTLLCNDVTKLNRNIESSVLNDMWMSMSLVADTPSKDLDFTNTSLESSFTAHTGSKCGVKGSFLCAALYALSDAKAAFLSMKEVVKYVKAKCPTFSEKNDLATLQLELTSLLFRGILSIRAVEPIIVNQISKTPAISKLAMYQMLNNLQFVNNQLNDGINVPLINRLIMVNLDGKNNVDQITEKVSESLSKSGNELQLDGKTVTDKNVRLKLIQDMVNNTLQFCLSYGFLVG